MADYPRMSDKARLEIGREIKSLRVRRGWNGTTAAEELGFSKSKLYAIERGEVELSAGELLRLRTVFGLSADAVLDLAESTSVE